MLHVQLIGPPRIEDTTGATREMRGQKPWAVLARLVLADRPLSRRELGAELFANTDDPLGSLRWCLARLRKALGSSDLFTGDPIRSELPPSITVDVIELQRGLLAADAAGEFLEGIDPRCGPEFSTWLLVARQQVGSRVFARLREETIAALARGDADAATSLAQRCVQRAPFDEGGHVLLVKSLMTGGHTRAALDHMIEVEATFRRELGVDPSPALRSAARERVADPPPGVSVGAVASTLLESGRAALVAGAIDAGLDCLRQAGARAEAAGDDALLAQCFYELGSALVHSVRGFDDEGTILLEQAAQLARAAGDGATAVAALRERGYADALAGRRPEAQRHLDEAEALAGADARLLAGVHTIAGFNLCDWGRAEGGLAHYDAAIDAARRSGARDREAWALGLGGWAMLRENRARDAVDWAERCLVLVRELSWRSFEPWPLAVRAEARLALARGDGVAPADLERYFAMSCQLEDPCWESASGRVLALHHAAPRRLRRRVAVDHRRARALHPQDGHVGRHARRHPRDRRRAARRRRRRHRSAGRSPRRNLPRGAGPSRCGARPGPGDPRGRLSRERRLFGSCRARCARLPRHRGSGLRLANERTGTSTP